MSWTDDRIDTLKKLWNDGESASAIAHALGQVTRNAVIGKVHRLGLAGRVSRSRARKATPIAFLFSPKLRSRKTQRLRSSSPAPATTRLPRCSIAFQRRIAPELGPPPDLPVTVQSLTESTCRWPEGDPKREGFHFCGRIKGETAGPYCGHHAAIAFR